MSKIKRKYSNSKIYHIILKGIDDNNIFYDNQDRKIFLDRLKITKKEYNYKLYAYCLMGNHVHMVIRIEDEFLSKAMQSLTIRYASYFNKKYDRKGPFVQNRFKSKNIENQRYFLEVCRYVHRNPEKAGIEKTNTYKWSSYQEYVGREILIDKKILLHYFNNEVESFVKYTNKIDSIEEIMNFADFELSNNLKDEEVIDIIMKRFKIESVKKIGKFFKENGNIEKIKELKKIQGISQRQIARITTIGRKKINEIWNQKEPVPMAQGTKKNRSKWFKFTKKVENCDEKIRKNGKKYCQN